MTRDKGSPPMDEVRARVEKLRKSGELAKAVRSSGIIYGLDEKGRLVAEYTDGWREVGSFVDGRFIPDHETSQPSESAAAQNRLKERKRRSDENGND